MKILPQSSANITESRNVEFSSAEGAQLVSQYSIDKIPAILFRGEINKTNAASLWQNLGGKYVKDSILVESIPPYKNVSTNHVNGLVDVVMLTDNSCANCYNVTLHEQILSRFGVFVKSENTFDISSSQGKNYLSKYNITKVPTILLSPDANVYLGLRQAWQQVGTIENDGWFVFRFAEVMGNFTQVNVSQS